MDPSVSLARKPSTARDRNIDPKPKAPNADALRESSGWHAAYDSEAQVERRRLEVPKKLRKLGIDPAGTSMSILDLCCGNGETLEALYQMGFRRLYGLDIAINPRLAADERFQTHIGDAAALPLPDHSQDWILIVHALHHLGPAEHIDAVLKECRRVLKPGGRLALVDFPSSPQIRLAFWFFRKNFWLVTPYLKYFGRLIQEEWHFLKDYLRGWKTVHSLLHNGMFTVERFRQEFFYYYLTLRKEVQ